MKTITAILFSALLLGTQLMFVSAAPVTTPPARCGCSACKRPACCAKPGTPVSSQPAVPAPAAGQQHSQFLLAVLTRAAALAPSSARSHFVSPAVDSPRSSAVSLYQRDCSFRI